MASKAFEINISLNGLAPAYRGEKTKKINPLIFLGYENTLGQTWMIDLRPGKDVIWGNMEKRARNAIRKAEKSGVVIHQASNEDDIKIYYDLHCKTYHRTGVKPHPRTYFEAIWKDFISRGMANAFFAEYNGQVVAAENFAVYKNAAVYWTGATNELGLAVQASSLIQWSAIQWMISQGIEWYETGEGFPNLLSGKLKGLSDFKKSFGGELFPLYRGRMILKQRYLRFIELLRAIKNNS